MFPKRSQQVTAKRSLVLCASPRSGSNVLANTLTATERCGNALEYFNRTYMQRLANQWKLDVDDVDAYMEAFYEQATTPNGILGTKLFWEQLWILEEYTPNLPAHLSWYERLQQAFPQPRFVYLTRDNKVRQAISLVKASQTGVWTEREGGTKPNRQAKPTYNYVGLTLRLMQIVYRDALWEQFFSQHNIEPMRLTYEQFDEDPEGTVRAVLRFMEIEDWETIPIQLADNKRQSNKVNEYWYKRYMNEATWMGKGELREAITEGGDVSLMCAPVLTSAKARKNQQRRRAKTQKGNTPKKPGKKQGNKQQRVIKRLRKANRNLRGELDTMQHDIQDMTWLSEQIPIKVLTGALWQKLRKRIGGRG